MLETCKGETLICNLFLGTQVKVLWILKVVLMKVSTHDIQLTFKYKNYEPITIFSFLAKYVIKCLYMWSLKTQSLITYFCDFNCFLTKFEKGWQGHKKEEACCVL